MAPDHLGRRAIKYLSAVQPSPWPHQNGKLIISKQTRSEMSSCIKGKGGRVNSVRKIGDFSKLQVSRKFQSSLPWRHGIDCDKAANMAFARRATHWNDFSDPTIQFVRVKIEARSHFHFWKEGQPCFRHLDLENETKFEASQSARAEISPHAFFDLRPLGRNFWAKSIVD